MASITGKDTKPELTIRKSLFAEGFRYRLNVKTLAGRPDIVLRRYRAVIFVHGCFWHGHECHLFKWPKTRAEFWREKIGRNLDRDRTAQRVLRAEGWRVAIVWECALRGKTRQALPDIVRDLSLWIRSDTPTLLLRGSG